MKSYEADMWSVGVMLFEIIIGFPIWLSLKGKISTKRGPVFGYGYFGIAGRD